MTLSTLVGPISSQIGIGGHAIQLVPLGILSYGGIVINPDTATENLFVSLVQPATLGEDATTGTTTLIPGQSFIVPASSFVWANAATTGHQFNAYFVASNVALGGVTPVPGTFPPTEVTGLTEVIPSYLYQEYSDDDDLQAFVVAQNALQQNYVDTFNALNLPIYTGNLISGPLLDWVAIGLYGFKRPWIYAQRSFMTGPLNTWGPNTNVALNAVVHSPPRGAVVADDDFYKRALTWHYQKGDGRYFDVRWLKRRIMRFLMGVNGSSPHIDQTNQISVSFGINMEVTIRFVLIIRNVVGGAVPNKFGPNGVTPGKMWGIVPINSVVTITQVLPPLPYMTRFAEAMAAGVLELPFQFNYNVVVG